MNATRSRKTKKPPAVQPGVAIVRSWFTLSPQEISVLAGVLAIFLLGLLARYVILRGEKPEFYQPTGVAERPEGATR